MKHNSIIAAISLMLQGVVLFRAVYIEATPLPMNLANAACLYVAFVFSSYLAFMAGREWPNVKLRGALQRVPIE